MISSVSLNYSVPKNGIESSNVPHRVIMHICFFFSVIRMFALKTVLGKFMDGLMLLLP